MNATFPLLFRVLLTCSLAWAAPAVLAADPFPTKPLRLIVPFPPGGATDGVLRLVAQRLTERVGQQVIVDNRPGAGTLIATEAVANAPADGHTLLAVTAAYTVNPSLYRKLPYDADKDFAPVTQISFAPNVLVVNPTLPVNTPAELVSYAKAHPGTVNYASAGNGTSNHIAGEMLRTMAGIDIVHVPYKGDAPAITDLIGGQVQMLFIGWAPIAQHVKSGRLKALAVTSGGPSTLVPGLPPLASTVSGFQSSVWNGVVVPARTPVDVIAALQRHIAAILAEADVKEKIRSMGFEPVGSTPVEFRDYLRAESRRSAKVVQDAGIKAD
jgi:tripartite-type tricarboxylate transporter receptor subunit TctC